MSTRRAIRSTRTNRCGAPATRRSPASAVRTDEAPSAYHTAPTAARTGRPSAHCAFPAGKRRPMGRDKVCSRKTVPELRDIKHRAAGASKRRSVGRRAVGTPGLLWKMQRSGSQGNLFAFLGNMSYFCRVSADRPPPRRITPSDTPPHLRGAIRTQLFNRTKTIRPQCVCRPEPVPKSLLTGRNGRRILSAWR